MTNQEAKMAWAEGKRLEYRHVNWSEGVWVDLEDSNTLSIFDTPGYQFRVVQGPIVLECVVTELMGVKYLYHIGSGVANCPQLGIDPPLGARVKVTVEVE